MFLLLLTFIFFSQWSLSLGAFPTGLNILDIFPQPLINGQLFNISVQLTTGNNTVPTGPIMLYFDNDNVKNQTIPTNSSPTTTWIVNFTGLNSWGGNHTFTVKYLGDVNYSSSNSSQKVNVGSAPQTLTPRDLWWAEINVDFTISNYLNLSRYADGEANEFYNVTFYQQENPKTIITYFFQNTTEVYRNSPGIYNIYFSYFNLPYTGLWLYNLTLFGNENYSECSTSAYFNVSTTDISVIDVDTSGALVAGENVTVIAFIACPAEIPLEGEVLFFYPSNQTTPYSIAKVIPNMTQMGSGNATAIPYPFMYDSAYANSYNNYIRMTFKGVNYTTSEWDYLLNIRPVNSSIIWNFGVTTNILPYPDFAVHLSYYAPGITTQPYNSYLLSYNNDKFIANSSVTTRCPFGQDPCYDGETSIQEFVYLDYAINNFTIVYVSGNYSFTQSATIDTCLTLGSCEQCSKYPTCGWCELTAPYIGNCFALNGNNTTNSTPYNLSQCPSPKKLWIMECPQSAPVTGDNKPVLIAIIVLSIFFGSLFLSLIICVSYKIYKNHRGGGQYQKNSI